ncbi:MAG: RDD family protein [Deltaproteobacteria bacterium]|jgi:uncharacterized RDD family membrane protein YckC|nr:RDD family protein [Deltaproteobacteria bacterium]
MKRKPQNLVLEAGPPRPPKQPEDLRVIISPEGLPLAVTLASVSARINTFLMDLIFIFIGVELIDALISFFEQDAEDAFHWSSLFSFILVNLYFIFFELAWQGRTPGKTLNGLRVVNRHGGELTPTAVVGRNLTRMVELFLPLQMLFYASETFGFNIYAVIIAVWVSGFAFLPYFQKDHLRLGDLIGGTMVITMPKKKLLPDLSQVFGDSLASGSKPLFAFSAEQLSIYGHQELQALENILRVVENLPTPKATSLVGLKVAAEKIRRRVSFAPPIPEGQELRFLVDFYTALRAVLEKALLFGHYKFNQYFDKPPLSPPRLKTPGSGPKRPLPPQGRMFIRVDRS